MKNNQILDEIVRYAVRYEQMTGKRPEKVYLNSGQYSLYWDLFSNKLLEMVDTSDEEQAIAFSRNIS